MHEPEVQRGPRPGVPTRTQASQAQAAGEVVSGQGCSCGIGDVVGTQVKCRHGRDIAAPAPYGSLPDDQRAIAASKSPRKRGPR